MIQRGFSGLFREAADMTFDGLVEKIIQYYTLARLS